MPALPVRFFLSVLLFAVAACRLIAAGQSDAPSYPPVQIAMHNVHLHLAEGITLDVRELRGEMISRKSNQPPVFGDPKSYTLHVFTGEASMTTASLTALLNDYLFSYDGAPLKELKVETKGNQLRLSGKVKKGVEVPFSVVSDVSVSPDGRLLLRTDKIKAAGLPAKGLMDFFDLKLEELVSLEKARGVTAKDNDLLLDPARILPPPVIQGHLASVRVEGDRIIQTFTSDEHPTLISGAPKGNYILFRGGVIRLGKLTMSDADLALIDSDPRDPFDFYPEKYLRQLVAGYSKSTADGGLRTYMPDFDQTSGKDKGRSRAARHPSAKEASRAE